ncbi:MAG: hypothetical protein Q9161_007084 [Pseudevernia consocians]
MENTKIRYAHCTNHPILPRNQSLYLMRMLISKAEQLDFDITRHRIQDWNGAADEFNAKFEGKRLPGCAGRQTKKTVVMLHCALLQNREEYRELFAKALRKFRAKKRVTGHETSGGCDPTGND